MLFFLIFNQILTHMYLKNRLTCVCNCFKSPFSPFCKQQKFSII
ncbi:hypothetical protein EAb13_CDS0113 [Acinetobacter phage EAb13]|nr:hypothetical protein EAb13_CDS0113 [Acinetobacter phage EAb13]